MREVVIDFNLQNTAGASRAALVTLPAGFRPIAPVYVTGVSDATMAANTYINWYISTSGDVQYGCAASTNQHNSTILIPGMSATLPTTLPGTQVTAPV